MSDTQGLVFYVPNYQTDNGLRCRATMGMPGKAQISRWLHQARKRKNLTRRAVSVVLNVTEKSVMRWEDPDDTPLPPADKFLALVLLYKADVGELLARRYVRGEAANGTAPTEEQGGKSQTG